MPRATPRTPREPLTRERVLHAAVALADEQGLDALSMRRLGQRVGVEAMSLYNHVANKDDVLAGMVELVFAEIEHPPADAAWKEAMRRTAVSSYQAFMRHRWACGLAMRVSGVSSAADAVDGGRPAHLPRGGVHREPDAPRLPRRRQPHHGLHALAGQHAVRDPRGAGRPRGGVPRSGSPPTATPTSSSTRTSTSPPPRTTVAASSSSAST